MIARWKRAMGLAIALVGCKEAPVDQASVEAAPAEPNLIEPPASTTPLVQFPGEFEGHIVATLPDHWRVGSAPTGTTPLREGLPVALQRDGLFVGNLRLLELYQGRLDPWMSGEQLVPALDERVRVLEPRLNDRPEARGTPWDDHAILYLDPDLRVGDLVAITHTLARHGFISYQIAVASTSHVPVGPPVVVQGLHFSTPKIVDGVELAEPAQFVVALDQLGVGFGLQIDGADIDWYGRRRWDQVPMVGLERVAAELAHGPVNPGGEGIPTAVFVAEPGMPIARLLEAMSAASGRACIDVERWQFGSGDPNRCHFVERILRVAP